MVQFFLNRKNGQARGAVLMLGGAALLLTPVWAAGKPKRETVAPEAWAMSLEAGRKLTWERSFSTEKEVNPNRGFWTKLVDVVAGEPDYHYLVRPYSVASDSRGREIVTDPGAKGVHIFYFAQRKYKFIQRLGKGKDNMPAPQCVAVDGEDNIYVTDSEAGEIFVFEPSGKLSHVIGSIKGGEGYFKRPTGIAVDSAAKRIYVTDTLRDEVFVLDMQGTVVQTIGKTGDADGDFNLPTELLLDGPTLLVVDAMNFRIQAFDRSGTFKYSLGKIGDSTGSMFRPKGVALDSEGNLYVADAWLGAVQVFNRQGDLLYYFGGPGIHAGEFQLPAGLYIDHRDKVFVVDSLNRRVQQFQYVGLKAPGAGGTK